MAEDKTKGAEHPNEEIGKDELDRITEAAMEPKLLYGDLRDAILQRLRAMPKPWTTMSSKEQAEMIESVERATEDLIRKVVHLVAAFGRPTIEGQIESLTAKDGIGVKVVISKHAENRLKLLDAVSGKVLLVLADHEGFMGERAPAKPDDDQRALPLRDDAQNVHQFHGKRDGGTNDDPPPGDGDEGDGAE